MFEDEYRQMESHPVRIEYLLKDSCMVFPPTTTPLSGVEFIKRLPSGDIERARRVNLDSYFLNVFNYLFLVDSSIFSYSCIVPRIKFNQRN